METEKQLTWIHLSDIHFGHGKSLRHRVDQKIVCDGIIADVGLLTQLVGKPDFIFVTGDIAFSACGRKEYPAALEWLNELASTVKCSGERILMVPGNHDVSRASIETDQISTILHQKYRRAPEDVDDYFEHGNIQESIWNKFSNFSDFASSFGEISFSSERPFWKLEPSSSIGPISIVGLNTALLSHDDNDRPDNLSIGSSQLKEVLDCDSNHLTIVLMHHPLSWMCDGTRLQNALKTKPHLLFCGHVHDENGLVMSDFNNDGVLQFVAGAGHTNPKFGDPNHGYSWGRLSSRGIEYYPRLWSEPKLAFVGNKIKYEKISKKGKLLISKNKLPPKLHNWLPPVVRKRRDTKKTILNSSQDGNSVRKDNRSIPGKQKSQHPILVDVFDQRFASWFRSVLGFTKIQYAQVPLLASQLHKELRKTYRDTPYDFKNLRQLLIELNDFLIRNTRRSYQHYFNFLLQYFRETAGDRDSDILPRICVKSNLIKSKVSGEVIPVARDSGRLEDYDSPLLIQDNTGFMRVKESGEYFCCNNIPISAKQGEYINPRLLTNAVAEYEGGGKTTRGKIDHKWMKCWVPGQKNGVEIPPDWRSCYKSTMIFPIAFLSDEIEKDFIELFETSSTLNPDIPSSEINKTVFGYLCLDHVDSEFFNTSMDVSIGYAIADAMALFLLTILRYTAASETYNAIDAELARQSHGKLP